MLSAPSPQPILPVAWIHALDGVQVALVKAEAEAAAREQTAVALPLPPQAHEAHWHQCLERIEARCRGWKDSVNRAEREVQEVDASLASCEDTVRGWLAGTSEAVRSLATWVVNTL
jgi:hypothetical protein